MAPLLAISEESTLFNLIGTTYGGDGQNTFALPDLQGRVPIHQGTGSSGTSYSLGQRAGAESVALTTGQIPPHTHPARANTTTGPLSTPAGHVLAASSGVELYRRGTTGVTPFNAAAIGAAGNGVPHDNRQPSLAISFIIALEGIYPSPN